MGKRPTTRDYMIQRLESGLHQVCSPRSLQCPNKTCKLPCLGQKWDTFLSSLSRKGILGTSSHQLPKAPEDRLYCWRYDQVLRALMMARCHQYQHGSPQAKDPFIPQTQGDVLYTTESNVWPPGYCHRLATASGSWQTGQITSQDNINTAPSRHDHCFINFTKQLINLELTVPLEECKDEANERKCTKYQELLEECRRRGWRTRFYPPQGGCRGFARRSLCRVLALLGLTCDEGIKKGAWLFLSGLDIAVSHWFRKMKNMYNSY